MEALLLIDFFGGGFIVDFEITYTLYIGEVRKPRLPGDDGVNLFLEFTIRGIAPEKCFEINKEKFRCLDKLSSTYASAVHSYL